MLLIRILLAAGCLLLPLATVRAQISDNFSDGDFTQNPAWTGDTARFIVNAAAELQLNAPLAGSSQIAVQGNIPNSAAWDLRFRLAFSPSGSNLLRIYLQADQENLAAANGYFIEVGETGSSDALRLFRQTGASVTLLGTGVAALVAVNPDIHLVVNRSSGGQWTVEAAAGTAALEPQLTASDATYSGGSNRFFGFQCVYTVSNINKYFFDDIQIGNGAPDTQPPQLITAGADNELQVTAVFNEPLAPVSPSQFNLSGGIGQPAGATLSPDGLSAVLTLATPLATGTYTVESNGVADISGNVSGLQSVNFLFIKTEQAAEFDILINEIMADQTPSQGLPEVEWLELYNRSAKTLELASLRIQDATGSPVPLPAYTLQPGAYVALTATINAGTLQAATSGPVLGVPIGVSTLNNDGDIITLSDAAGTVIDRVAYEFGWHDDPSKKDGGWSLERVNPGLPCLGAENWRSCPVLPGGTPGLPNASLSTAPDNSAPRLLKVVPESATSLLVFFSEGMDKNTAENAAAYRIEPARQISAAVQLPDDRSRVRLSLSDPLQAGTVYSLSTGAGIGDCSGNPVPETDTVRFGLAEQAELHDIIINEIMAKPAPAVGLPVAEYLELYNRSAKIIDLASLRIQDLSGSPVALPEFLLVPGQYVALTALSNVDTLRAATGGDVLGVVFSSSLLNDDGDVLTLSSAGGALIDRVAYDQEWHTEPGKEDGGWSLERIDFDLPCLGKENWQSCPDLPGGTPGYRNASYQSLTDDTPPILLWAYPESSKTVMLSFYEGLDKSSMEDPGSYEFIPPVTIVSAVQQPNIAQVLLTLSQPMDDGVRYLVTVKPQLIDCSGNAAEPADTVQVGIPQIPEPRDIVISEIMFNPATGNERYVEFYNRSDKLFDWTKCYIEYKDKSLSTAQITQKRLSVPGQYHVFTRNAINVRSTFQNIIYRNVMENSVPTMSDQSGRLRLYWALNGDTVELDAVNYSDDWHNSLYSSGDRDGVALERIRIEGLSNDAANWTSASSAVTGAPGTPTLPNSQRLDDNSVDENLITLDPARLSPDGDGYEDFLDIRYELPQAGYFANVGIFDSDGNRIKYLGRQELLGTSGALRWDGDAGEGLKARPGIHILFLELFGPDGTVKRIKKTFVLVLKN